MKEDVLAEGVWNFALSFENSDCREPSLIREPVTAEASTGMRMDGSDVFADVQIVSFTIRAYGATILTPEGTYGDFGTYQDRHIYVFMKDGSRVEPGQHRRRRKPNQPVHQNRAGFDAARHRRDPGGLCDPA